MRRHVIGLAKRSCRALACPRVRVSRNSVHFEDAGILALSRTRLFSTATWGRKDEKNELSWSEDTIYALSTASGKAGIAIVRISGPVCADIYHALCPKKPLPKPRFASLRTILDPVSGIILDSDAIVLHFPATKTVTGEDVLELHIHGGPATVKAVLAGISRCGENGNAKNLIRYAEPGEFTRRAFQNNRLDLAQVEALSDTLSAETEQQRRAAVRGNSGSLDRTYESWRHELLYARGELEAIIDFSEDQDFDTSNQELLQNVQKGVEDIIMGVKVHEDASHRGEMLRKGIRISMLGPPNAGKSSLLNRIVGREASIVSTEAGTTRDVVEVSLDIAGYLCTFADTAGLRSALGNQATPGNDIGKVEAEGIRRAKAKAKECDLILILTSIEPGPSETSFGIQYDLEALRIGAQAEKCIIVVNKTDTVSLKDLGSLLGDFRNSLRTLVPELLQAPVIPISCIEVSSDTNHDGIGVLMTHLLGMFEDMTMSGSDDLFGVTERQRQLLLQCRGYLNHYIAETATAGEDCDIVLAAEHLRSAANCLSRITGRGEAGDVEEVLGVVFEKFCVGK